MWITIMFNMVDGDIESRETNIHPWTKESFIDIRPLNIPYCGISPSNQ